MKKPSTYYIGWDVGGWNCDKNGLSRDAIVILHENKTEVGTPWRGNLSKTITSSKSTSAFLVALFNLCKTEAPSDLKAILAIDTPLGFSLEFIDLLTKDQVADEVLQHANNPYLFRKTEKLLYERGHKPMSPIKDMIGSQATKGIHARLKFTPYIESCGVWTDKKQLRIIEAYPSSCNKAKPIVDWVKSLSMNNYHADIRDASICAMAGYHFHQHPETMFSPPKGTPEREGWIWTLKSYS